MAKAKYTKDWQIFIRSVWKVKAPNKLRLMRDRGAIMRPLSDAQKVGRMRKGQLCKAEKKEVLSSCFVSFFTQIEIQVDKDRKTLIRKK